MSSHMDVTQADCQVIRAGLTRRELARRVGDLPGGSKCGALPRHLHQDTTLSHLLLGNRDPGGVPSVETKETSNPQTGWGPEGNLPPRLSSGQLSELGRITWLPDHLQEKPLLCGAVCCLSEEKQGRETYGKG